MSKPMSNYNERLTTELVKLQGRAIKDWDSDLAKAKQAITSLIKELVDEAKPDNVYKTSYGLVPKALKDSATAYDVAIQDFEQNLLKALEEV